MPVGSAQVVDLGEERGLGRMALRSVVLVVRFVACVVPVVWLVALVVLVEGEITFLELVGYEVPFLDLVGAFTASSASGSLCRLLS